MQALINKWLNNFKQSDKVFSLQQVKNEAEWAEVKAHSNKRPVILFKHSNRCSLSDLALERVLKIRDEIKEEADFYIIDVVRERSLSRRIAEELKVGHASPQLLVIQNGKVIAHRSHNAITATWLKETLKQLNP